MTIKHRVLWVDDIYMIRIIFKYDTSGGISIIKMV